MPCGLIGHKQHIFDENKPSHQFYMPEITPNFSTTSGFRMKISMKLVHQNMAIFINFSPQVENCDSNSRLVVDEDDNGKFRLARVNIIKYNIIINFSAILTDI